MMERCWNDKPNERPCVDELVEEVFALCSTIREYENRYVPLIDKTTGQQAFAHPPMNKLTTPPPYPGTVRRYTYYNIISKNNLKSSKMFKNIITNYAYSSPTTTNPPVDPLTLLLSHLLPESMDINELPAMTLIFTVVQLTLARL